MIPVVALLTLSLLAAPLEAASATRAMKPAAPPAQSDPVAAFRTFIATASTEKTRVRIYQVPGTQTWVRHHATIGEIKYDVKKTDSLVNPMVGIVSFPIAVQVSRPYDNERDAQESNEPPKSKVTYAVDGTFHFAGGNWGLHEFKYKHTSPGSALRDAEFTLTSEKLVNDRQSTLGWLLQPWVPGL